MKLKIYILLYLILFFVRGSRRKSRIKIYNLQQKRFKRLCKHLAKSPFYKDIVGEKCSLNDFPVINKKIFMENFNSINIVGISKEEAMEVALNAEENRDFSKTINNITVGLSTGTSGNKGIFLANEKERARWVAAILHRVVGFKLHKRKIAFFLRANSTLYESANSGLLKFRFFDLMNRHEENFIDLVDFKADILIAQPSALINLARSFVENNITPGFKKIISVAEVLDSKDRSFLQKVFNNTIDEVYQCTEGFLACTCSNGKLHFNEDFLIIEKEFIDEDKTRFYPIITDLLRYTQPVIRYKLDDIIIINDQCECDSNFTAIEQVEGRADDVIKLKDKNGAVKDIYPDFFRRVITSASDDILDYVLIQTAGNVLKLYTKLASGADNGIISLIENHIRELLLKFDVDNIELHFTDYTDVETGKKLRRIRNEYFPKC